MLIESVVDDIEIAGDCEARKSVVLIESVVVDKADIVVCLIDSVDEVIAPPHSFAEQHFEGVHDRKQFMSFSR